MSELVGNPEDRFSHVAAHFTSQFFRDVGDLGGVTSDSDKAVDHEFTGVRLSLFGPLSIIGRSVIVGIHKDNRSFQ